MIPIRSGKGWRTGPYAIVASSASAKAEWDTFLKKAPKAMQAAFERLSREPLEAREARQFPLKGKHLKPFWQYEITGGDRLYYAVDLLRKVVVVAVLPHAAKSSSMAERVQDRRSVFDAALAAQQADGPAQDAAEPARVERRAKRR